MKIFKMNGAGNSFVILDLREVRPKLTADRIRELADPEKGLGADQVIALEPSLHNDVFMRIWNADGSEVSACGNATRCVGWLVMRELGRPDLRIETAAGRLKAVAASPIGVDDQTGRIAVDMGSPLLKWEEIPLAERMDTRGVDVKIGPIDAPYLMSPGCVNMGNPHAVFFVPDVMSIDIPGVGPLVEWHPLFPEGVNVGFAQVLAPDRIRLRVWERGAGLTRSCGTGACAAVVAAHRRGLTGRNATVITDGGNLDIHWRDSDDHVIMTGPIELEYVTHI